MISVLSGGPVLSLGYLNRTNLHPRQYLRIPLHHA